MVLSLLPCDFKSIFSVPDIPFKPLRNISGPSRSFQTFLKSFRTLYLFQPLVFKLPSLVQHLIWFFQGVSETSPKQLQISPPPFQTAHFCSGFTRPGQDHECFVLFSGSFNYPKVLLPNLEHFVRSRDRSLRGISSGAGVVKTNADKAPKELILSLQTW